MTHEERMRLLSKIRNEVKEDPSLFADIVTVCNSGVEEAINAERQRAADMETIAVGMYSLMTGKYREKNQKWITGLIKSKIERWSENSHLGGWDKVLDEM
jgi:acyl-CoA reductase-like NAD-dependent aldehyde dehydrogenase